MDLSKLHDKPVNVAFRLVHGAKDAQGFMTMSGILTESGPDYICLSVPEGGGRDRYFPMDVVQFIDAASTIIRPSSLLA